MTRSKSRKISPSPPSTEPAIFPACSVSVSSLCSSSNSKGKFPAFSIVLLFDPGKICDAFPETRRRKYFEKTSMPLESTSCNSQYCSPTDNKLNQLTFRICSALDAHLVAPSFSLIESSNSSTWATEIFDSDDCALVDDAGPDPTAPGDVTLPDSGGEKVPPIRDAAADPAPPWEGPAVDASGVVEEGVFRGRGDEVVDCPG